MALISIIIPAYNCESTLGRCMDSILGQDFKDFEILLVDDGSTDGTPTLCDSYAGRDKRVNVIHKANGGVSSARNAGLDKATGTWVTFADSDDELTEGALSYIAQAIQRQIPESVNLIIENLNIAHPGESAFALYGPPGITSLDILYNQGLWGAVWNKTFSRDIIEKHDIRFDESLPLSEDCLYVATYCAHINGVDYIDTPCYTQYTPESYGRKYSRYNTFEYELELYRKIKAVNHACSIPMVDSLTMSLLRNISSNSSGNAVSHFKEAVGEDIRYARGKKKFAIRCLKFTDRIWIWESVFRFYARLFD